MEPAASSPASPENFDATQPVRDWRWWARRLLVCNPFFLVSAALLLFAINRLSTDPQFLGGEEPKLLFNFGTLQVYGGLLVLTAVALGRRRVWYDSALLVVVEHGLVLVPFILIAQAALIGQSLAAALIGTGAAAVALRAWVIRRWYPRFNLPARALALGAGILGVNVVMPLWFRHVVDQQSVHDWVGPNRLLWLLAMPLIAAGANFLPRPRDFAGLNPERPWLPIFIYGFWLAGTGVHAASVGYLGTGSSLTYALLTPCLLATGWTLLNRLGDFLPVPGVFARRAAMGIIALLPLLAWREPALLLGAGGFNFGGFLVLAFRGRPELRRRAIQLATLSAGIAVLGIPAEWIALLKPSWGRLELALALAGIAALVTSGFSRHPVLGIAAGLIVGVGAAEFPGQSTAGERWQIAIAVVLAHSLRWPTSSPDADHFRRWVAGTWLVLVLAGGSDGTWTAELQAVGLLMLWMFRSLLTHDWSLRIIPASAFIGVAEAPLRWAAANASAGMIALAASFALFAAGTWFAWQRKAVAEHSKPAPETLP